MFMVKRMEVVEKKRLFVMVQGLCFRVSLLDNDAYKWTILCGLIVAEAFS